MIRVNYIKKKKKEDELLKKVIIIGLILLICIKLIDGLSVSLDMKNVNSEGYGSPHVNLSLYKMAINQTICGFEYSNQEKTLTLTDVLTELLFDFNINNQLSMITSTIPYLGYIEKQYALQNGYASEVIPILSTNSGVIDKNNPQYYNGIHQDEIISIKNEVDVQETGALAYTFNQLNSLDFLTKYVYAVDTTIDVSMEDFDMDYFLNKDMSVNVNSNEPKILIFHTHSQEAFKDSRSGVEEDTIVGVGGELAKLLEYRYGVKVIHDKTRYDMKNGVDDHNHSYDRVDKGIPQILEQYPSIEVVIDLHRDGVNESYHPITSVNGKSTAKIMFFNGICKRRVNGVMEPIKSLPNPNLKDNMAFSFQMHMKANELYGDLVASLTRKIYLKPYRYSTHFKPKSLLVEVGAQTNTVQEAKNAMEPLAKILYEVLTGK